MATLYNNTPFLAYTTLDTFPQSSALTGTISNATNSNAVFGVGTLFTTETDIDHLGLGYLWNGSTEWRKITAVDSDTLLYIDKPFTVALVAATCKWIPECRARSIGWVDGTAGSTGGGKVNNVILAAGEYEEANVHSLTNPNLTPIIVDGTGGAVHVLVSYE